MSSIHLADPTIFDLLPVGVLILSQDRKLVYCNEAYAGILRTPLRRLKPGSPLSKNIPESSEIFSVLDLPQVNQRELTLTLPSGINPTLRVSCQPIELGNEKHFLLYLHDVSIEKHLHERYKSVSKESVTDEKTGLYNSRYFETSLADEFAQVTSHAQKLLGLVIIDIDFFKQVNDKHGHLMGDEVLKHVSACIKQQTPSKGMAARYGGEEFCVLLHETTELEILEFAEKLRLAIEGSGTIPVTVSLGVSLTSPQTTTSRLLFEAADEALYEAKRTGRNKVVFNKN
jgi:diguanylate cyclase (GGDEF)-like protein